MPRTYEVIGENQSVSAASDLVQVKGAASKILRIKRWWWKPYDNSLVTAQNFATRCRVLPATVTDGNGAAATPQLTDPGDAAATFTALINSSSKATTNGTATIKDVRGAHVYNGDEQMAGDPIILAPSTSFVFELTNSSIQGTVHLNFGVEVEELG